MEITIPDILLRKAYGQKYDCFEVAEPAVFCCGSKTVIIPEGYQTDFASVPQFLWGLFPPHGRAAIPSLIHDYFYDNRLFENELGAKTARAFADEVFLDLMEQTGVPLWQRLLYYYVVRYFAASWWRR